MDKCPECGSSPPCKLPGYLICTRNQLTTLRAKYERAIKWIESDDWYPFYVKGKWTLDQIKLHDPELAAILAESQETP